jgi:hypothetical protein
MNSKAYSARNLQNEAKIEVCNLHQLGVQRGVRK